MNEPARAPPERFDVAVAGAGVVGLALALAVRLGAAPRPTVAVYDPDLADRPARSRGLRAVAVTAGSRRFLDRVGVWAALDRQAQPITGMVLSDAPAEAVPRVVALTLRGEVGGGEPFAQMVLHDAIRDALAAACAAAGVALRPRGIEAFEQAGDALGLRTGEAEPVRARLLVASDGGRSRLRERAGIPTVGWDYNQSALVATVGHGREHDGTAVQHFMPNGPLALLPMLAGDGSRRRTSLVWVERPVEAGRLAGLDEAGFTSALQTRIGHGLGTLRLEDRPVALPLRLSFARRLAGPRLALVGDAARTIHPLAGQGLNHGLKDAAALAGAVLDALKLGLDPGDPAVLDAYARARRPDSVTIAAATDLLNRLFGSDNPVVRLARTVGLGLTDRSPVAKRLLMWQAAGVLDGG